MKKSTSSKNLSKPFSREDWFILCLFCLLLFDILVHFFHPAYKFYRETRASLNKRLDDFEHKVTFEFVPTLALVASNNIVKAELRNAFASSSSSAVVPSPSPVSSSPESRSSSREVSVSLPRGSHSFKVDGVQCANISGFTYLVGDNFDGSPILFINPVFMQTSNARYTFPDREVFRPSLSSSRPLVEGSRNETTIPHN